MSSLSDFPSLPIKLSIVAPIFNSRSTIREFVERCRVVAEALVANEFELILVDDCSTDGTLETAIAQSQEHSEVVVIELARNYGQHLAILSGLRLAKGEMLVCIDGDCDEDPRWIEEFWHVQKITEADIVIGVNHKPQKSLVYQQFRFLFLLLLGLRDLRLRPETTARLMTRQVASAVVQHAESRFYFGGVMNELGFKRAYVPVAKGAAHKSRYNLRLLIHQMLDAVTSFSARPLRIFFLWGLLITILSALAALTIISLALIGRIPAGAGWISVLVTVTFFWGNTILSIGIIGEYLLGVVSEVKRRPQYFVRRIHRKGHHIEQ
jgi:putative glycosyltransferase